MLRVPNSIKQRINYLQDKIDILFDIDMCWSDAERAQAYEDIHKKCREFVENCPTMLDISPLEKEYGR